MIVIENNCHLIKGTPKTVSKHARENESGFVEKVRTAYNAKAASTIKEYKKQITKAEKRQDELDNIVKKLLEANAADRIPDSHFDKMFAGYANEQDDL